MRSFVVPISSSQGHHYNHNLSTTSITGTYQKLLQRRQDLCSSAKRSSDVATSYEQTVTFIEQLKRNQNRAVTDINYVTTHEPQEKHYNEKKTLTPQQLSYQLNIKLDHLIRTRVIERNRVISRINILPKSPIKSKVTPMVTPREHLNRATLSDTSLLRQKDPILSSNTTANTTILQDDLVDKDSFEDNDEICEELGEEENINFLQP